MHPGSTGGAGISTSLWGPVMVGLLPGFGAELDEILFPLLGVLARLSVWFVVQVMLFVLEDLLKPLNRLFVNGFVVLVECGLPGCLLSIMQCICPFPSS